MLYDISDSRSRGYDDGGRASGGSGGRDRRYVAGDDDDDGEVRTRRKDVGKSRLSSRTSRTADRVTPTSSSRHAPSASSSSGKNDLLGDWDAEPGMQMSRIYYVTVGGEQSTYVIDLCIFFFRSGSIK